MVSAKSTIKKNKGFYLLSVVIKPLPPGDSKTITTFPCALAVNGPTLILRNPTRI